MGCLQDAWNKYWDMENTDFREAEMDRVVRDVDAEIERLRDALRKIHARATPHPDDTSADLARNLYHVESLARNALKGGKP